MSTRIPVLLATAALALTACQPNKGEAKFNTELPMTELMGHVVDPAAFMYWKNSGSDITEAGEVERYPTTDEGWDVLVTGASIVMESGNLLQMEGRTREPVKEWNRFAQAMTQRAKEARDAAEKHDKQAVFDAGGRLYETCVACHERFIIQAQQAAGGQEEAPAPLPAMPEKK